MTEPREDINIEHTNSDSKVVFNEKEATFSLAKVVLLGLFALTVFFVVLYVNNPSEQSKEVFEFFKIAAPPLATLVLSAYFKNGKD